MQNIIFVHLFLQITPDKFSKDTLASKSARFKHYNGNYSSKTAYNETEKQKLFQPYKSEE